MKTLIKFSGLIISLLGVIVLVVKQLLKSNSNTLIGISLALMLLGLILFVIINQFVED